MRGPSAYASILVAEEILDTWQRELMKDERVQPITRMVARIHVLEEARHMTFARDEVQRSSSRASRRPQLVVQQNLTAQTCLMVARSLVNPKVYLSVGIDPREGRRAALGNPHYRETMQWMGEKPLAFLRENGLLPEEPGARVEGLAAAGVKGVLMGSWVPGQWGSTSTDGSTAGRVHARRHDPSRSTAVGTSPRAAPASTAGSCSAIRLRNASPRSSTQDSRPAPA